MSLSIIFILAAVLCTAFGQNVSKSYTSFGSSNSNDFQVNMNAAIANGNLRLTTATYSQAGTIFLKESIDLQNGASFSTAFAFKMPSPGGFGDEDGLGADGIVFCINSLSNNGGSYGGGLGYQGIMQSVGIEFDTYDNGYPTDINGNHVGIDINGNVNSVSSVAYPTRFNDGQTHYAWVDYDGTSNTLEVRVADAQSRPAAPTLSYVVNLISVLKTNVVYVGFTGSTGGAYEEHDITGWSFANTYAPITAPVTAPTSVCGNGIVEPGEACDGGACCSSQCTFVGSSTVCRPAVSVCDVAETCTGSSSTCPANAVATTSTVCRPSAGICDVVEYCDGVDTTCPNDAFAAQGTECRHSIGPCDPAEQCTGSSASCPADVSGHFETQCNGLFVNLNGQGYSWLNYDVISFNGFVANTGDIEGRAAVRNNATVGNGWSVGYQMHEFSTDQTLPYSMVVGSNFKFPSGAVYPDGRTAGRPQENMFVGDSFTGPSYLASQVTGNCNGASGCMNNYFDSVQQCYGAYQNNYAAMPDNVVATIQWSGLTLSCNSSTDTTYVVSLTPSQMTQYTYMMFNGCSSTARWIVNIRGTGDAEITGGSFYAAPGSVIYNIIGGGRRVKVHDTQVNGNILAPYSTVTQTSGVVIGKVIAGNIDASLQINRAQCFTPQ